MRKITQKTIEESVKKLALDANFDIGKTFLDRLKEAMDNERSELGKTVLGQIIENDEIAERDSVPMCQDTGLVVVFLEVGYAVELEGDIYAAINEGIKSAYRDGSLRKSVVADPLVRINTEDNTPAIIHTKLVAGDRISITLAPKGAGSENMSLVRMLLPSDGIEGIEELILETVFQAGGKPCPPIIVGVGIGGNLEKSALIAKEALLREVDDVNPDPKLRELEEKWLERINELGVGPMGFGGTTTALAVKIATHSCHIASLPVAINIQCHAARHKSVVI
ncbi:MAG: fumarate hydratase [Acholeplasmataceae bacterium]